MINALLKAKHWHLFLLTVVFPIVLYIVFLAVFVNSIIGSKATSGEILPQFFYFIKYLSLLMLIPMACIYAWQWSVVHGLDKKIPEALQTEKTIFKITMIIPILMICVGGYFFIGFFEELMNEVMNPTADYIPNFDFLMPFQLLSMACGFYNLYFVSKAINTAELQRETVISDLGGDFVLAWLFPIGIWFLQPRINALIDDRLGVDDAAPLDAQI